MSDKVDFLYADKHKRILQIDTMTLMKMIKHSQSSQNSKFSMPLSYLKKEVRDEVDILHSDKHQSFLQVDTIIIDGRNHHIDHTHIDHTFSKDLK